jgi:hypothetical protein
MAAPGSAASPRWKLRENPCQGWGTFFLNVLVQEENGNNFSTKTTLCVAGLSTRVKINSEID